MNCYLILLDVLDSYNIDWGCIDVMYVFKNLEIKVLMMGFIDDLLYLDDQVCVLGECFKYYCYFFVFDNVGYDGFLLNFSIWVFNLYYFLNLKYFKCK